MKLKTKVEPTLGNIKQQVQVIHQDIIKRLIDGVLCKLVGFMHNKLSKIMMKQFIEFCDDETTFRCAPKVSSYCHKRAVMMLAYAFGVKTIWHKRDENGRIDLDVYSRKVHLLDV